MKNLIGKIKCIVGWHTFTFTIKDCMKDFGYIPLDDRMPKTAKYKYCSTKLRDTI